MCFEYQGIIFHRKKVLNFSQMLRSSQGGLTPPPPYGQPDRKISGFFLTASLSWQQDNDDFSPFCGVLRGSWVFEGIFIGLSGGSQGTQRVLRAGKHVADLIVMMAMVMMMTRCHSICTSQ